MTQPNTIDEPLEEPTHEADDPLVDIPTVDVAGESWPCELSFRAIQRVEASSFGGPLAFLALCADTLKLSATQAVLVIAEAIAAAEQRAAGESDRKPREVPGMDAVGEAMLPHGMGEAIAVASRLISIAFVGPEEMRDTDPSDEPGKTTGSA